MVEIISITCPSCGATINSTEQSGRYRCEYCGNVHIIRDTGQPLGKSLSSIIPLRVKLLQPGQVRMTKDNQGSHISYRWFSFKYIPMAFFCVFWDGFLFFWYGMAFNMHAPMIFILFPILHVLVGISLTYSTLAGFINRTNIDLTHDELSVWFEPLLWLGEKTLKVTNIKQIYCKEKISYGKNGTVHHRYILCVLTHDLHQTELLRNLDTPDLALFLEQQLEEWLQIPDQPVVGELSKG